MLGFDEKDSVILAALKKGSLNMLRLAQKTGVHERTVAYRLKRLKSLGLVGEKPAAGNQKVWGLSESREHAGRGVEVYYGKNYIRAYSAHKTLPKNTIIYTIEGFRGAKIPVKQKLHNESGKRAQRLYRARNITLKTITHSKTIRDFLDNKMYASVDFLKDRTSRSLAMTSIDSIPSLIGPCLYAFTPRWIAMHNEQAQFAVLIKDKALVTMWYEMMAFFYNLLEYSPDARTVDFNQVIRHALEKKLKKEKVS